MPTHQTNTLHDSQQPSENAAVSARRPSRGGPSRYLTGRALISLIVLASLVVPGIVAVIAAAVSAF
jgi:hypothetical protein